MRKLGFTALITTTAAVLALAAASPAYWHDFGWVTPSQHDKDFAETVGEMRDFRDEWKCDEYSEELLELMQRQAEGFDSPEVQHKIERIKKKMDDMECSKFDDFD